MASRSSLLVEAARRRTLDHVEALPAERSLKFRANCRNVAAVCENLFSLRPVRNPTSPAVAEEGGLRFQGFPSKQSLDNRYSAVLAIWREAYAELLDAGPRESKLDPDNVGFVPSELASLDAGTRKRVELLLAMFRETVTRCNNLTRYIGENIPFEGGDGPGAPARLPPARAFPADVSAELRSWIGRLDNGSSEFNSDELGVRVSRRCRPGTIVMSRRLLDALRDMAGAD